MATCQVTVTISVDDKEMVTKKWPAVDVMKLFPTRSWARRKFNIWLADLAATPIGHNKIVRARWEAYYGAPCHSRVSGGLSGFNGKTTGQSGVFEK